NRMQVDLIKFSGPAYAKVDNRLMSLQLVSQGLTDALISTAEGGEMVQAADILYKKAILVERGSFRPVTYATNDMLNGARTAFLEQSGVAEADLVVLMEMTLENLLAEGQLNHADFLERRTRSEEHTSELQSQSNLVCRLLLEKKKHKQT